MHTEEKLLSIASQFALAGEIDAVKQLGEGFINDSFVVKTKGDAPNYILQRKNKAVFPDVPAMMDNIERVTAHIRRKVVAAGGNPDREVLTVVKTKDGKLYHVDENGEYWAVCLFIEGSVTYDRANSPALAYKGGQGIGRFQSQLADFDGKAVGAQTGTTKADIVTNDMPGANLVALQLVTDLVNQLMYDKVDAVVVDGSVANQYVAENDDFVIADASSELGAAEPYCVAVQKGDPKGLLPGINEAIAKINEENKMEEFVALADSLSGVAEEVSADAPAE